MVRSLLVTGVPILLVLRFYSRFLVPSLATTAVGLFIFWQTESLSFVFSYTLGKVVINGLIGWLHHYQKDSQLAYYNNLGIPTAHLYSGAFLTDMTLWILLTLAIP